MVRKLLAWYDANRRILPWRFLRGEKPDPYRVWLSEIMLQQTTVATVGPYFQKFTKRWPTISALASAPVDDIMSAWAGLGYYSRARNLHACAKQLVADHRGALPADERALLALPGIGPYTAAAIAAIAFGMQAAPVDGNIERVLARLCAVREPLPAAKPRLRKIAEAFAPAKRSGDFAQAMMDLGATVCTPRSPSCTSCPWSSDCLARKNGIAHTLPARKAKAARPLRRGASFVVLNARNEILLRRRPPKGLLAGMHETPMSPWGKSFPRDPQANAPMAAGFRKLPGLVHHTFTHFELELEIFVARLTHRQAQAVTGEWAPQDQLARFALPSIIRKVIESALIAKKHQRR